MRWIYELHLFEEPLDGIGVASVYVLAKVLLLQEDAALSGLWIV